jgi:hypothetical protein
MDDAETRAELERATIEHELLRVYLERDRERTVGLTHSDDFFKAELSEGEFLEDDLDGNLFEEFEISSHDAYQYDLQSRLEPAYTQRGLLRVYADIMGLERSVVALKTQLAVELEEAIASREIDAFLKAIAVVRVIKPASPSERESQGGNHGEEDTRSFRLLLLLLRGLSMCRAPSRAHRPVNEMLIESFSYLSDVTGSSGYGGVSQRIETYAGRTGKQLESWADISAEDVLPRRIAKMVGELIEQLS